MNRTTLFLAAAPIVALSFFSPDLAHADVPPKGCTVVGQQCSAMDSNGNVFEGTCEQGTCDRALPDGGTEPYACLECFPPDAAVPHDAGPQAIDSGVSTVPVAQDDGGSASDAGTGRSSSGAGGSGGGGCSVGSVPTEDAVPGLLLLAGIGALAVRPRRHRQ